MKLTNETLKEFLSKIGYSIKGTFPNSCIFNNENENTVNVFIDTSSDVDESELIDYIKFSLGFGSISQTNPLISEAVDCYITDIEII